MRRFFFFFLFLLLSAPIAIAADLSRKMPVMAMPNDEIVISFSITGMEQGKEAAIDEILPVGFSLSKWYVEGAIDDIVNYTVRENGLRHTWIFKAADSRPKLVYRAIAPGSQGSYSFNTVYMLPPAEINNLVNTIRLQPIRCGDGVCDITEDTKSCEKDCPYTEKKEDPVGEERTNEVNPVMWAFALAVLLVLLMIKKKKH